MKRQKVPKFEDAASEKQTTIRIEKNTRKRLKKAIADQELRSYDEWINKKLNEEQKDKK